MTIKHLKSLVPQIDWLEYLNTFLSTPVEETETVVAYAMPYFVQMGKIISESDIK